jgi:uncharacterized membrane protein (UPF0127 family)
VEETQTRSIFDKMKVINATKRREIAGVVVTADTVWKRLKGLLGQTTLRKGHSLWLKPCKGIHTIGMKFPIDAIFLDKKNTVVAVRSNLLPNRVTRLYLKAASVIELSAGGLSASDTEIGDVIEIV